MGFGLLLIGYFAVYFMTMNPVGSFIRLAGYCLITYASVKLRKYHRSFSYLTVLSVVMLAVSAVLVVADVSGYLYNGLILDTLLISESQKMVVGYVDQGLSFFFQTAMLYGIRCIARETEIKKISTNAIRNFIFVCFYYFVYLLRFVPFSGIRAVQMELTVIAWVSYFVWIFLNIFLLFSCYSHICDEGDTEMTRTPSRFDFINRFRAEFDRREEKAMRESAEYRQEKRKKRRKGS